ncbi:MAG: xanthine dehydrogenase family protein subunit M [Candidatus Binataceae bacterium]|jgi:carbon-monoxide dehydrogenase medium subunit
MISQEFEFHAPKQLSEALNLLQRYGDDAKVMAGGMSLVPMMTLGLVQPKVIVSFNHIRELEYVSEEKTMLRIGAMTRHCTIRTDPLIGRYCPLLAEAASYVGDVQVRHRGTIGGSLAHADPAADYPTVMLVIGAQVKLRSAKGERVVKMRDFLKGLMLTDLQQGELLTEIQIPKLADGSGSSYQRLHRVEGNFAIVNAAAVIEKGFKAARLGLGGVGETAVMVDISKRLAKGLTDEALRGVSDDAYAAAHDAYGDLNGDADYRKAMARVYAQRVVKAAAAKVG